MKTELLKVCDALVTAGLNGVLQGILLLLLVMLGMRWFGRRTNATTRHAVYLVALLFLALLIPANGLRHFLAGQKPPRFEPPNELAGAPRENHLLQPVQPITHNTAGTPVAPAPTKPSPLNFVFLPLPPEQLDQQCTDTTVQFDNLVQIEAPTNLLFQAPAPFSLEERRGIRRTRFLKLAEMKESETIEQKSLFGTTTPPSSANAVTASTVTDPPTSNTSAISGQEPAKSATETASIPPLAQAILEAASAIEASATEPSPTMWDNFKDRLVQLSAVLLDPISLNLAGRSWIPAGLSVALVTGCALFAAFRLGLVGLRLRRIRQLKFEAFEASPELVELFSRLCAQTHAKRKVTLGLSETQRSAVLLGFRNPKILLPAECDVREAEPVLRHELAHLSRRDDWANLCQQLIHATLFFHPGVWWVCRQLTLEREIACDDCVLEKSTPRSYALLLATLAGRMQGSPALLAPGVSTNKSQLQQRIDMILDTHRNTSLRVAKTRLGLVTSAAACLALAAIYTAPRIVFAQSQGVAAAGIPATAPVPAPAPPLGAVTATPGSAALAGETIAVDEPLPPVAPATSAGPRYKTLTPVPATPALSAPAALPPRGVIALTPAPGVPAPPMALVAPTPATPPLAVVGNGGSGGLTAVYGTAPQPRRKDTSNMSVEERLNRLERMIESLSAKKEFRVFQPNDFKWEGQWKMNGFDEKQLQDYARAQADMAKRQVEMARKQLEIAKQNAVDPKEIEKLKEQIERETARAGEEIKRATRDMERAMREQQQQHPRTPEARNALPRKRKMDKDAKGQQLEGLRRQHEALERQMERLDRQIEELEQSQEELEQQDEENEKENADLKDFPKGARKNIEVAVDQPKPECSDSKNVNASVNFNDKANVNTDVKANVSVNDKANVNVNVDAKPKQ